MSRLWLYIQIRILVHLTLVLPFSIGKQFSQFQLVEHTEILTEANQNIFKGILQKIDYLSFALNDITAVHSNAFIHFLLKQTICPLQLSSSTASPTIFQHNQRHRAIIISNRTTEPLEDLKIHATRGGFLFCVFTYAPDEQLLTTAALHLWQSKSIHKIYYLMIDQRLVFFNPFLRRGNNFGALINLKAATAFEQIFQNLNGYPLRTYIFDSVYSTVHGDASTKTITSATGPDGNIATLLSRKMNFTMALQWPDDQFFGARLENGSYNGAIGRMIRHETDITLTGFFVKDYLSRDIDFSVSVYMDELCCYVQKAKRIPQSILPLFAIHLDMWLGFLTAGIISPVVWMLMRFINLYLNIEQIFDTKRRFSLRFQCMRIAIDCWLVWVRVNILKYPPFNSERIFLISLSLVSVIFGAIFESSLATVYIRPLYYKDINTLQDLDDANLRIYIKHAAMKDDLFYGQSSQVYQNLNKKLLLVAETEERLISMMSKRGGFVAVTRASSLVLDDIRYFIANKINKIPECPKNYHIAFVLGHHSPYEKPINVLLLKFLGAGLVDHWIHEVKHKARTKIHKFPDYVAEHEHKWKILTLKDLQLAFYALCLGCTLSSIALACEILLKFKLRCKYLKLF